MNRCACFSSNLFTVLRAAIVLCLTSYVGFFVFALHNEPNTLGARAYSTLRSSRLLGGVNWEKKLEQSRSASNFEAPWDEEMRVHLISLSRSSERRLASTKAMELQNVSYILAQAVDGLSELHAGEIDRYASKKKRQSLHHSSQWADSELMDAYEKYKAKELAKDVQHHMAERFRFGCTMSHVRLWLKLLSSDERFFVIMEDDGEIVANFTEKLFASVSALPRTWDLFYLSACDIRLGGYIAENIRQFRGGSCTIGYLISRHGAEHLIYQASPKSDLPVDKMMNADIASGRLNAFYAEPPLVNRMGSHASTIDPP